MIGNLEFKTKISIYKIYTHENPIVPSALLNISPKIDGYEFPDGKYAKKFG